MREFINRHRLRSTARFLPLLVGWLVIIAIFGMRLINSAEWNSWSLQFMWRTLESKHAHNLPSSIPAGHGQARIWLAWDALSGGNTTEALALVEPLALQNDPFALHVQAAALEQQGDFAGALVIWQQTKDIASLLRAADQAQQAGRLEEALMAYEAAWTLNPELGTMPLASFLLNIKKDYGTAEKVLRQSMTVHPESSYLPLWSNRLGDMLRAQRRWDEAAAAYENTIIHAPDDWAAHIGLGSVRYERGDGLQAAMSEFQKAINVPESQGSGQLAIALVLTREKRFEEADVWFVQALALNPDAQWWYVYRGDAAWQARNLALALAVFQETVARFPDFAQAYYEIAFIYRLNEQPAQAMAAIERALALMAPPNVDYYTRAGNIYEWTGDKNRALNAYRQALLIDPQNAAAHDGVERLDK